MYVAIRILIGLLINVIPADYCIVENVIKGFIMDIDSVMGVSDCYYIRCNIIKIIEGLLNYEERLKCILKCL